MTNKEAEKIIKRHCFIEPLLDFDRAKLINTALGKALDALEQIGDLQEYKDKMELQWLDDINNPLEPIKLASALRSEIMKYEYRKEHKPKDISPLDFTIMYALKKCLEEQTKDRSDTDG